MKNWQTWSEDATQELRRLAAQGLSGQAIARVLTHQFDKVYTRNSVISKVTRLSDVKLGAHIQLARERKNNFKAKSKALPIKAQKPVARPTLKFEPVIFTAEETPAKLFKLAKWPDHKCRWCYDAPDGSIAYGCDGEKPHGSNYCAKHHAIVYTQPVVKQRVTEKQREFA